MVLEGLRHLAEDLPTNGHLVEIGAFAGESTQVFMEAGLHVDAIDPWDAAGRDQLLAGNVHEQRRFTFDVRDVELAIDQRVAPFADRLRKFRGRDEAFVERYADSSLDAVYIDSVHTTEEVHDTISRWWSKLRVGGVLAGHDYSTLYPGVIAAVQKAFGEPERVYADTSWAVCKRAQVAPCEAPRVGLLYLITDGLTQPTLWREWLDAASDRFRLFVHCKHPEQLSSDWLREHLIREYVPTVHSFYWPHNAIAKAQVALLRAGLADQSITKLAFISQSTIPIVSPDEAYYKLTRDDKSWIDREGFCEERYVGLKPGVIPREHYQKSSNWLILNRRHAWQCVTAEAQYMDAFVNSPAADEHYFHTILSIQGIDYERETWPRCGTYVDWQRGSPYVFESLSAEELEEMRQGGFLLVRKVAARAKILNITRRSIP